MFSSPLMKHAPHYQTEQYRAKKTKPLITIAFLIRSYNPSIVNVISQCTGAISQSTKKTYKFVIFNGEDSEQILFSHALLIAENHQTLYDAAISIGAGPSLILARACRLTGSTLPTLFSNVHKPEYIGLAHPRRALSINMSGVAVPEPDIAGQIDSLKALYGATKHVLLPFSAEYIRAYEFAHKYVIAAAERSITTHLLPINKHIPFSEQLMKNRGHADVIVTLRDVFIASHIDELTRFSDRYHIPTQTADLSLVKLGATFGYAAELTDVIAQLTQQIWSIFEEDAEAYELPVGSAELHYSIGINRESVQHQNISLDQRLIEQLPNTIMYGGSSHD